MVGGKHTGKGIVDMHCDTISYLESAEGLRGEQSLRKNLGQLDLLRMERVGYVLQNFAIFVDMAEYHQGWDRAMHLIDRFQREMRENADLIGQVRSWNDVEENLATGRISALLTVEEGGICEGRFDRLERLYALGVCMMTVTWNHQNELGMPANPDGYVIDAGWGANPWQGTAGEELHGEGLPTWEKGNGKGLTPLGVEFVREMERIGMIIDLSHLSDEGAWDILRHTKRPVVASHSNARRICDNGRNLPDEIIRRIGERGGCIGLNFYGKFVGQKEDAFLENLARHARHIVNVGGMECLGLGSDFDGMTPTKVMSSADCVPRLWEKLQGEGFTEGQLDQIFSENVLRLYRENL